MEVLGTLRLTTAIIGRLTLQRRRVARTLRSPLGRSGLDIAARGIAQGRLRSAWIAAWDTGFADREARR